MKQTLKLYAYQESNQQPRRIVVEQDEKPIYCIYSDGQIEFLHVRAAYPEELKQITSIAENFWLLWDNIEKA